MSFINSLYEQNTARKMGNCCGRQRTDDDVIPATNNIYVKLSERTDYA